MTLRTTATGRLLERIVALARTSPACVREATAALIGDTGGTLAPWEDPALQGYLAFGQLDEWCGRAVDTFARGGGATLPSDERRLLPWMQHAWFSVFEVEHDGGEAVVLRDLAAGELVVVRRAGVETAESQGNVLMGWAVSFDDGDELTSAVVHVRQPHREPVVLAVRHELECARALRPHLSTRVLLREAAGPAHVMLRKCVRAARLRHDARQAPAPEPSGEWRVASCGPN